MHIGQTKIAPRITVGQPLVVQAKQMQHRGMEIVNVHGVLRNIETKLVTLAVTDTWLDAPARHPDRKTARMVVPPVSISVENTLTCLLYTSTSTRD